MISTSNELSKYTTQREFDNASIEQQDPRPPDPRPPRDAIDFSSIMFLSTGGATIANRDSEVSNGGNATWQDYRPYARRLFWRFILPGCSALYLTSALLLYTATICDWESKNTLAISLVSVVGVYSLLVVTWSGVVAYRLRHHRVVINRGLVYVCQMHIYTLLSIPILCLHVLNDTDIISPNTAWKCVMDQYTNFCTFLLFSALVARQRQIAQLFGGSQFDEVPKHTYRNTVLCVSVIYVASGAALLGLVLLGVEPIYYYLPLGVANLACFLLWFYYGYLSRHASSQFSDFEQLRRLFFLALMSIAVLQSWAYAQHEAFIVQNIVILGLLSIFLLDSYVSLFNFIRDELDPQRAREVAFAPPCGRKTSPSNITTTVACHTADRTKSGVLSSSSHGSLDLSAAAIKVTSL